MAYSPVTSEIEAKLLTPRESDMRSIARLTRIGPYPLRPRAAAHLHSVYVDTASLTLARHGVALRLRRCGGQWEATAKWEGHVRGAVHERPELTIQLPAPPRMPFSLPEGALHTRLAALVAGRVLQPVLITDIYRRRLEVLPRGATGKEEPVAELALDRVHLRGPAGGRSEDKYLEVEIELRHGQRRDVTAVARLLRQRFDLVPSRDSKFSRGLALLYGAGVVRPPGR